MKQLSIVERARGFAVERHGDQLYSNELPYAWHLGMVADLAVRLGYPEEMEAAAWLHDSVEDTDTTIYELSRTFGRPIAIMVDGVTYTEQDRLAGVDKIAKARRNPGSHALKLCDANINLAYGALNGAPAKFGQWGATIDRYGSYVAQLQPDAPTPHQVNRWLETIQD